MSVESQFIADHRPGCLTPSASGMPCLFIPRERLPGWVPTVYEYAMHLTGQAPRQEFDGGVLQRGRWIEPCGRLAIKDTYGIEVIRPNGDDRSHLRREAPALPAVCWLDDIVSQETAVEYKSVSDRNFADDWLAGPPDVVLGQVHAQMTIDPKLKRVIVVPIIFGFAALSVERFVVERDPEICDLIAGSTSDFVQMLRRGELPEYDGSEASYRVWSRRYPAGDEVLDLSEDPEAVWRAGAWYQAVLDRADVDGTIEAHQHWFSCLLDKRPGTGRIRVAGLPKELRIKKTTRKAYSVAESSYLDWRWVNPEGGRKSG
jgi:hypothetical protein